MRKICISLSKGGVAKSTSAVSIAHGLALTGKKVLLVDTDDQGHISNLLGIKPQYGLADVLNEELTASEAKYEARENLFVLSGGKKLSGAKRIIGRKEFGAEQTLANQLSGISEQFDFVIIDTSPAWDTLTINALFYSTELFTPVSLESLSLTSLAEFTKRIEELQKFNPNIKFKYLLPTFLDGRVKKSKEIMELLKRYYGKVLCDPIRYCSRLSEASGFGQTIFEYANRSTGAIDYRTITNRILNE